MNTQIHADKDIDDSLSGTTSISIYMRGSTIYVSNVGDSRAIILSDSQSNLSLALPGHNNANNVNSAGGQKLTAKPLSVDQTPYRKDERERVKKCGARVMSMDQVCFDFRSAC
jgi:serine/threonine protein phosphatase PrpC